MDPGKPAVPTGNHTIGLAVGALTGTGLRVTVAVLFLLFAPAWGHHWWGPGGKSEHPEILLLLLVSGGIGFLAGGLGGLTCRPVLGAILGCLISSAFCIGLFVIPASLLTLFSQPTRENQTAFLEAGIGLIAMALAGAVAGGAGALAGRWSRKGRTVLPR